MNYLIKRVVRTEKTEQYRRENKYVFDVDVRLNKPQIKRLFKQEFAVDVIKVNTHIGALKKRRLTFKTGYLANYKRAIVQLLPGQNIPML